MSCKVNMTNGVSLNFENQMYTKTPPLDATVKFAGEEAKDRLYEPKHKKKVVRVLTVIAYVFFVSLAAIMLSLYYIFIWHGEETKPTQQQYVRIYSKCDNGVFAEMQRQLVNNELIELRKPSTSSTTTEENTTWLEDDFYSFSEEEFNKSSPLLKKLFYKKYPYAEND